MVKIEFVDVDGDLLRTEFWYSQVVPRRNDWIDLKPRSEVVDDAIVEVRVSGTVSEVEWLGDGEVRVFVV